MVGDAKPICFLLGLTWCGAYVIGYSEVGHRGFGDSWPVQSALQAQLAAALES